MSLPLWVPLAELGIAACVLVVAGFLLRIGHRRAVNRSLALVLGLEAVMAVGIAGIWLAGGESRDFQGPFLGVLLVGYSALPWIYLRFLSVLDTPVTKWLRRPQTRSWLFGIAAANAVLWAAWVLWAVFIVKMVGVFFVMPWWPLLVYFSIMVVSILAVAVFALAASISAWRRTAPGTLERARARAFTAAFGVRDGMYAIMAAMGLMTLYGGWPSDWPTHIMPLTTLLYVPLLVYGVLKTQLFDIDLHLRRGLRATFMSIVFVAVLVTTFELLEKVVAWQLGWAAGLASAVVLTFGVKPVERAASRLAHKLVAPPDPATLEERRRGIYRVAFREVWQDGRIEAGERERLTTLGARLGLAPRDMAEIEDAVVATKPVAGAAVTDDTAQGLPNALQ